tara:strand:- start:361 stop:588 length:228 start_codon:yes stop_codon:yes gene_type:complete
MKNISTGNWVTIIIVSANIIFMVAFMSKDVLNAQESASTALTMAHRNDKKIAVIETKIEQGFSNLEKLIIKTNGK